VLFDAFLVDVEDRYAGYPTWMIAVLGWGSAAAVIVFGVLGAAVRWRAGTSLEAEPIAREESR